MTLPRLSPSALFLMTFVVAILLSWYMHWRISTFIDLSLLTPIGVVLLLTSLTLNTLSYRAFKSHKTPYDPFEDPQTLIQNGIFRFSRNPVYLALVLSQLGLAFIFDSIWLLLGSVALFFALDVLIVRKEEITLKYKFNEIYTNYKKTTRRWL